MPAHSKLISTKLLLRAAGAAGIKGKPTWRKALRQSRENRQYGNGEVINKTKHPINGESSVAIIMGTPTNSAMNFMQTSSGSTCQRATDILMA